MNASLIGLWKLTNGDYPLTREFRGDGSCVSRAPGFDANPIPFRIEGDRIIFSVEQPDGSIFEQEERFELAEDNLTFFDVENNDEPPRIFKRKRSFSLLTFLIAITLLAMLLGLVVWSVRG
jgi:hypothetical protein